VRAVEVTEQIYPISTKHEPDVPRLFAKLRELGVETLTLLTIGGVSQPAIVLRSIIRCMSGHPLGNLGVPEYSTQEIDHG
jgi:hypothetical protein